MNKYTKGVFYEKGASTIGVDFANKPLTRDELRSRSTSTCEEHPISKKTDSTAAAVPDPPVRLLTGEDVTLQIWDTTGQEQFKSMNKLYYRGVHGVVLVCDLTDKDSFLELEGWLTDFSENSDRGDSLADCAFVLLANKADLSKYRQ